MTTKLSLPRFSALRIAAILAITVSRAVVTPASARWGGGGGGGGRWGGGGGGGGRWGGGGGYGPYGGCCSNGGGSSTGEVLGAAALGAVGGMAVGSMMTANAQSQAPSTTIIENNQPYGYQPAPYGPPAMGSTVYSLPPGAFPTTINGSTYYMANGVYYKPFYSGSQVVYMVSQP
jgi:hypothetical protein